MKNFIFSFVCLILVVFCFDRVGGLFLRSLYFHSKSTVDVKIREVINDCNIDMIFLGSSRCHHHYDIRVIEDSIPLQAYNAGVRGGSNIYFNFALFELILEKYSPKIIVYDLIPGDFAKDDNSYDKLIPLSPYYGLSVVVDSLFEEGQLGWKYDLSHLYRFNGKLFTTLGGAFMESDPMIFKGFQPKFGNYIVKNVVKKDMIGNGTRSSYMIDKNKMRYIKRLLSLCQQKSITIVFSISPSFLFTSSEDYSEVKNLAQSENIPFLDYLNRQEFVGQPQLFYDDVHLNKDGARLYSSMIAHDLKRIIVQ